MAKVKKFKVTAQSPSSSGPGAPVNLAPDPNEWDKVTYIEGSDAWETATDSFKRKLVIEFNDDPYFENYEAGDERYTIDLLDAPKLGFTQNTYIVSEGAGSATIGLSASSTIKTATFILRDDDWNNDFANPLSLNDENGGDGATLITSNSTNVNATKELGEPNHTDNAGGASVWWSWTAPESRILEVTTANSDFDTLLGVYTGSAIAGLTELVSNNDSGSGLTSEVTFAAVAGTTYYIAVDGYNDGNSVATGNILLDIAPLQETFSQYDALSIPDQSTVSSDLVVSGLPGKVADVNVQLSFNHTYQPDLDVFLIGPEGTRVELFTDVGGSANSFSTNLWLDDEGFTPIASETDIFSTTYRPESLLSGFNGQDPNGTWNLEITDDAGLNVGTLSYWTLTFQVQ